MSETRLLVIDDEANIRRILHAMLTAEGFEVQAVENLVKAKEIIRKHGAHVILSDLKLHREDGLSLLKWMRDEQFFIPVIILTAHGTVDTAVDAMKAGAFDFATKPFDRAELTSVIRKAALTYSFQNLHFVKPLGKGSDGFSVIGNSKKMQKIYSLVDKVAPTDSTILITGESGTGKELIAQAVHESNPRREGPFIKINCAAIPGTLMESELFGYEKGAFTGAVTSKPGRFELADGGTLFLDEVAEMSVEMQVKLLRVLQDQTFERVGGLRTLKVNVRLVTATNKDLEVEVREGRFREDLFYRLNVVPINLPPLRDRREDIPLLVAYFVKKFSERLNQPEPKLNSEVLEALSHFDWPGNIRQLENVVERMIVMNEGAELFCEQLPDDVRLHAENKRVEDEVSPTGSLKDQVRKVTRRIERKAIEEALQETEHNITQAARKLNISRKGLQLKMKELGFR